MSYSETTPIETLATAEDLWFLETLFKADWAENISIESSFSTDIQHALSASEQRFGLLGKPVREITCTLLAMSQAQSQALFSLATRKTIARSLFPLFADYTTLASAALATDTVLNCDTTYKRFAANQRIVVLRRTSDSEADTFAVGIIESLTDSTITLTDQIGIAFDSNAVIFPLIEAQVILNLQGTAITQRMKSLEIKAIETEGPTQLEISQDLNTTPSAFSEYDGLPILDILPNEIGGLKWGLDRYGSTTSSGIKSVLTAYGSRGSFTWEIPYLQTTREVAWPLIQFFDSRAGSLFPFWLIAPDQLYTPLEVLYQPVFGTPTDPPVLRLRVALIGTELDWTFRPYIAVRLNDGTTYIRQIASVMREAEADNILLASSMPFFALSDIQRVTIAFKARLDSDSLKEEWITADKLSLSFSVRELLEEKDITISNLQTTDPSPLANKWKAAGKCGGCGAETIYECLCGCVVQMGLPEPPPFCCYVGGMDSPPDFTSGIVGVVEGSTDQNFRIANDERAKFPPGGSFNVSGSTGNDGTYTVSFSTTTPDRDYTYIFPVESIPDPTVDGTISTAVTHHPDQLRTAKFRSVVSSWTRCVFSPFGPEDGGDCGDPCDPWIREGQCPGAVCPCSELYTDDTYSNASIREEIVEMVSPIDMRCDAPDAETWVRDASMQKTVKQSGLYECFSPCSILEAPIETVEVLDGGLLRYNERTGSPAYQTQEWWVDPSIGGRPETPPNEGEQCSDHPSLNEVTRLLCELYLATLPHGCFDVDGEGNTFIEIDTGCLPVNSGDTCAGYARHVFSIEVEVARCSAGLWSSEFAEPSGPECTSCQI